MTIYSNRGALAEVPCPGATITVGTSTYVATAMSLCVYWLAGKPCKQGKYSTDKSNTNGRDYFHNCIAVQ